jgi:hypothetical protein
MLWICFWKRKNSVLGSREAIFETHSPVTGLKNSEARFRKWTFAAQRINTQHVLWYNDRTWMAAFFSDIKIKFPFLDKF